MEKNETKMALVEMIGLLSQAIDILRNHDADSDADYLEKEMEKTIEHYKEKTK